MDIYNNKQKGEAKNDFLIFIGIIILLFFFWLLTGGPKNFNSSGGFISGTNFVPRSSVSKESQKSAIDQYSPVDGLVIIDNITYRRSPWYGLVSLGSGNARSTFQPNEEYIILSTSRRNQDSIAISGWILENGENRKLQRVPGVTFVSDADRARIPQGIEVLLGIKNEIMSSIILKPGDRAIITTGRVPSSSKINLAGSFRVNKCIGYLTELTRNDFKPALSQNCPRPKDEIDNALIEDKCFDYISRLSRCHKPESEPFRDRDGDLIRKHLDGVTGLSDQCRTFVFSHYNYHNCVANHLGDKDFLGNEWRVYLKQSFEMWDKEREVITLYDAEGRLVDQLRY